MAQVQDISSTVFLLGDIKVHAARCVLVNDTEEIRVEPKAMEVLQYLVERPGEVVSRDALMNAVWGSVVVSDETVTRCVSTLRSAIGDSAQAPRYIETIPRRGYRLLETPRADTPVSDISSVQTQLDDAVSASDPDHSVSSTGSQPSPKRVQPTRYIVAGLVLVVLLAIVIGVFTFIPAREEGRPVLPVEAVSSNSIAVLPFEISGGTGNEGFVSGIHDEITNQLGRFDELRVISRTSVSRVVDTDLTVQEIATRLSVGSLVDGSVRIQGNRIRVYVQLIEAEGGTQLWSETYDREFEDVFAIEAEIAREVALALELIVEDRRQPTYGQPPTDDAEAYRLYMLAQQHMVRRNPAELGIAVAHSRRAVRQDPQFALAWVSLANALDLLSGYNFPPGKPGDERLDAIDTALKLDPLLADAWAVKGASEYDLGQFKDAEQSHLRALELQPNNANARYLYGVLLRTVGRSEEALVEFRKAAELDPLGPAPNGMLADTLWHLGRSEEALALVRQQIDQEPTAFLEFRGLSRYLTQFGRLDESAYWAMQGAQLDPNNFISRQVACERIVQLGDDVAAERCRNQMIDDFPDDPRLTFWPSLLLLREQYDELVEAASSASASATVTNADLGPRFVEALAHMAAENYQAARVIYEEILPPEYFSDEEFKVPMHDLDWAIFAGLIHLNSDPPNIERANYLFDAALATMAEMHRMRGGVFRYYGAWDLLIHAGRGDVDRAVAALEQVMAAGWREGLSAYLKFPAFKEVRKDPRWQALAAQLEEDMSGYRERFYSHQDDHDYWRCRLDPLCVE